MFKAKIILLCIIKMLTKKNHDNLNDNNQIRKSVVLSHFGVSLGGCLE